MKGNGARVAEASTHFKPCTGWCSAFVHFDQAERFRISSPHAPVQVVILMYEQGGTSMSQEVFWAYDEGADGVSSHWR